MKYMEQIGLWFAGELELYRNSGDANALTKAVKDKILESYRNGLRDGRSGKERRPTPTKA